MRLNLSPHEAEGAIYVPRRLRLRMLIQQLGLALLCGRDGENCVCYVNNVELTNGNEMAIEDAAFICLWQIQMNDAEAVEMVSIERDLSFLPHLLQCQMSWHEVTLTQLTLALDIPPNDLDLALMQPSRLQPEEGTHPVGNRLLSYRLDNNGALPTRMKFFYSWNLSSWISTATQDYRLRRCRRLLKRGPICLQETKWKGPETEALYQGLPGVQIAHTPAVAFNERASTGGVAILFPPGWQVLEEVILVKGRCVAALVQDRTCKFYVISVYIHPDNRSGDMEALLRAWRFFEKKSDYAFVAGDFNGMDKHHPQLWEKFLLQFQCSDVYPELATFRHARGVSCLDRGLVPDSLTNSSKLYASASVLVSHVANGHDIVKIKINVKPNVLNNPHHPKHEVIPSGVFMPGKDGTPISSTSELQSLVRLLHREHCRLFTDWHCEDVLNRTLSPPPPVTGRCSPLDNVVDSAAVGLTFPPPVTGRCSPQDSVEESAPDCPGYSFPAYLGRGGGRNHLRTSTLTLDPTAEHVSTSAQGHNGSMFLRMLLRTLLLRQNTPCYPPLKPYKPLMDVSQCQERLSSRLLKSLMRV